MAAFTSVADMFERALEFATCNCASGTSTSFVWPVCLAPNNKNWRLVAAAPPPAAGDDEPASLRHWFIADPHHLATPECAAALRRVVAHVDASTRTTLDASSTGYACPPGGKHWYRVPETLTRAVAADPSAYGLQLLVDSVAADTPLDVACDVSRASLTHLHASFACAAPLRVNIDAARQGVTCENLMSSGGESAFNLTDHAFYSVDTILRVMHTRVNGRVAYADPLTGVEAPSDVSNPLELKNVCAWQLLLSERLDGARTRGANGPRNVLAPYLGPMMAHLARCKPEHPLILEGLLRAGVDANDSAAPLWNAALAGNNECVAMLLAAGADVRVERGGATALGVAARAGHLEVVRQLFGAEAYTAHHRALALFYASTEGHEPIVKFMIESGLLSTIIVGVIPARTDTVLT